MKMDNLQARRLLVVLDIKDHVEQLVDLTECRQPTRQASR